MSKVVTPGDDAVSVRVGSDVISLPSKKERLLTVDGLTASCLVDGSWKTILESSTFSVGANETVAVVGESGSGKSITAMAIMRLLRRNNWRTDGRVILQSRNLMDLSERQMRAVRGNEVAMIFQEPMTSLNPTLTVGFQVAEVLRHHKGMSARDAKAKAISLLEKVRIPAARQRYDDYPHALSGGQRQRAVIAMALACRPKLLIADEPTTALDVTVQAQILDLIKTLQVEEQMGVLFITHDMGVVAEIADRTLVMNAGQIIESGATSQIFASPQRPYTRSLLAAVPRLGSMRASDAPKRFPVIEKTTGNVVEEVASFPSLIRSGEPILTVKGLRKRFPLRGGVFQRVGAHVRAVEGVSFSLRAGETLALVGESGCGKSTTGRAILRLIEPDSGQVLVDGEDVLAMSARELRSARRKMQIIFQDPFASLNPNVTVGEAIATPLVAHGLMSKSDAYEKVASLLLQVGLEPSMARRLPKEFSGGQRQRICIARALSLEPRLIIADEAVSALDVSVKAQVSNLLLDLQEQLGLSYLFISHDIAVVERISHQVAVMYLGEIVEIGPRAAVLGNPQHPYTKRLIESVPVPDPSAKKRTRHLEFGELRSPIKPVGYEPPIRKHTEVSTGHFVQEWDENDWKLDKGAL